MKKQQFLSCLLIISLSITPLQAGKDSYTTLFLPKQLSQLFKHNSQNLWSKIFIGGILAATTTVFFSYFYGNRKDLTHLKPWADEKGKEGIITFQTSDEEHVPLPEEFFKNAGTVNDALEIYNPTQPFPLPNVSCEDLNFLVPYLKVDISEQDPLAKKEKASEIQTPAKNLLSTLNAMNNLALSIEILEGVSLNIAQQLIIDEGNELTITDVLDQLPIEMQKIIKKEYVQRYPKALIFETKYSEEKLHVIPHIYNALVCPRGKHIVCTNKENQILLLNSKMKIISETKLERKRWRDKIAYQFNKTGTHILCQYISTSSVITKIFDIEKKQFTNTFHNIPYIKNPKRSLYFCKEMLLDENGTHITTATVDPKTNETSVKIWSAQQHPLELSQKLPEFKNIFFDVNNNIVAVFKNGLVKIWDINGTELFTYNYNINTEIIDAETDKIGKKLFALTKDFVHVFNLEQKKENKSIRHNFKKHLWKNQLESIQAFQLHVFLPHIITTYPKPEHSGSTAGWLYHSIKPEQQFVIATKVVTPDLISDPDGKILVRRHKDYMNKLIIDCLQNKEIVAELQFPSKIDNRDFGITCDGYLFCNNEMLYSCNLPSLLYSVHLPINFLTGDLTLEQINFCMWLYKTWLSLQRTIPITLSNSITLSDDQKILFQDFEKEIQEWMKDKYSLQNTE